MKNKIKKVLDKMKSKYFTRSINPGLFEEFPNGKLLRFVESMPLPP